MKQSITKSILKLKSACQALAVLVKNDEVQHRYRVISINIDNHQNYIATVQLVGKGQIFKTTPEKILSCDEMTSSFSQRDIRMLTYLGYLSINSPQYEILAQRLSEKDKKVIFAIKKRGEKDLALKSADELSSNPNLIKRFDQQDAHMIGYITAKEEMIDENNERQALLKSLCSSNDSDG